MRLRWVLKFSSIPVLLIITFLGLARHDAALAAQDANNKVEGTLQNQLASNGSADFIIHFNEQADLSPAYSMDWAARGEFVYNALRTTADGSQANAKAILEAAGLKYQTFINGNELYVWGGTYTNAITLAELPEISSIRATKVYSIDPDTAQTIYAGITWAGELLSRNALTTVGAAPQATTDWGITDSKADQFWSTFGVKGDGIVVASIDTGVQYNHPALNQAYKCQSNPGDLACWNDPANVCGGLPCDKNGHGTHTMGTMVAKDDPALPYIAGMAPNAKWIACLGCPGGSCPDLDLNTCADWILAPAGNPANRPDVVNNSWGGLGGDDWFQTKVQAWSAAGIFPAFSAGNSGPGCSTLGSPGDYQQSFGSAAHDSSRNIASFSSRGPSAVFGDTPYTKPNISAPGVNIISSFPTTIPPYTGWVSMQGTSMASPHSAGAVALLWSCNPALVGQVDATFQLLQDNADFSLAGSCGAPADGQGNYTYGYGYLNVLQAGLMTCGATTYGTVDGYVRNELGSPITGVKVSPSPVIQGNQVQAFTGPTGYYSMTIPVGTYDLTAAKVNYQAQTVSGVNVSVGQTTHQDFTLGLLSHWTQIPLPSGCPDWTRFDGEYYPDKGLVYFLGGRGGAGGSLTYGDIYSFDPSTKTCANTGADMPTPISNYTVSLVNNGTADLLCTFGGRTSDGSQTSNVQCYNPNTNSASIVNTMPAAWTGYGPYTQVVVNNKVYIFGGLRTTGLPYVLARTDRYDPQANTFTQMGDLSMARSYIMAAAVDGIIYAFGGDTYDGVTFSLTAVSKAERFDPAYGTWNDVAVADLPFPSGEGRAFGFDSNASSILAGKIILAGGGQWPDVTNQVISYDVATNAYDTGFPDLNIARRDQAAFLIPGDPGAMWIFGGSTGTDSPPYAPPEYYKIHEAIYNFLPVIMK